MSSPYYQNSLTKAALLSRANQSSYICRWEPPLYIGCRTTCVSLGRPLPICCHINPNITRSVGGSSVPTCVLTHSQASYCGWLVLVRRIANYLHNIILFETGFEPVSTPLWGRGSPFKLFKHWCQRVESNYRPSAYEANVLTDWTTRAYVCALCVDSSHNRGGFLLRLSKPSALLISEGNIKKERKTCFSFLPFQNKKTGKWFFHAFILNRNYLFHLTYILYHRFNNFTNYYWLWFFNMYWATKSARNGWTILPLWFAAIALFYVTRRLFRNFHAANCTNHPKAVPDSNRHLRFYRSTY